MTDNDNKLIESFFREAAMQQVEDNGFTERVMRQLPDRQLGLARKLSRLWTWFCIAIGVALFILLDGWAAVRAGMEVFVTTASTTDVHLNPVTMLVLVAFVGVYLPYQTFRRLSVIP